MLKYIKEALEIRRQAIDLKKAEKKLEKSNLDYLMLEKVIKACPDKEIIVKMANGTTLTIRDVQTTTYTSFAEKYKALHS